MATENGKKGFLWKTTKMGGNGNDKSADGKGQKKEDRNNKTRTDSLSLYIGIFLTFVKVYTQFGLKSNRCKF